MQASGWAGKGGAQIATGRGRLVLVGRESRSSIQGVGSGNGGQGHGRARGAACTHPQAEGAFLFPFLLLSFPCCGRRGMAPLPLPLPPPQARRVDSPQFAGVSPRTSAPPFPPPPSLHATRITPDQAGGSPRAAPPSSPLPPLPSVFARMKAGIKLEAVPPAPCQRPRSFALPTHP